MNIPIIIPSYEPDEKLLGLIDELNRSRLSPIIVVDDGSDGERFGDLFNEAAQKGAVVLRHAVNMGKGRALKTAFNYCLNTYTELTGVVTADSDGQHGPEDIKKCMDALGADPQALVLGVRNFDQADVPARSVFGNKTTRRVMKILLGLSISDTQTGLRGIGTEFMKYLLTEDGERYEFETNMLIATRDLGIQIKEVPIKTIYLDENKSSHFNPIVDSMRIYAIFVKFLFSSLSSSVVDMVMFSIFCAIFRNVPVAIGYIMLATIMARVISAIYNFLINYKIVFKGKGSKTKAAIKYFVLAICIMLLSGCLVTFGHGIFSGVPEIVVKVPVDCLLFLLSFVVQREVVYK